LGAGVDALAGDGIRPRLLALTALLLTGLCAASSCFLSANTYLMGTDKMQMPQYRFAETINRVENATLLNYGFLDGGFYYASGVLPTSKYFCKLNLDLPEIQESHKKAIEAEQFDFLVTRGKPTEKAILLHYTQADSACFYFEGHEFTYYLYRRNSLS